MFLIYVDGGLFDTSKDLLTAMHKAEELYFENSDSVVEVMETILCLMPTTHGIGRNGRPFKYGEKT